MMNFWRAQDLYGDHMVRRFEDSGQPLERIDVTSVMYGTTGTIYYRKTSAWKSGLMLILARGGWVNTIHGTWSWSTTRRRTGWLAPSNSICRWSRWGARRLLAVFQERSSRTVSHRLTQTARFTRY
jgi:hypothetical protein